MISSVPSLRVNSFGYRLAFYKALFVVYYWCLFTLENIKIPFLFLNTWSRILLFCFWFSSLINFNSSSSVSVHIMNRSSMKRKNFNFFFFSWEYEFWFEACHKNISIKGSAYCAHHIPWFEDNVYSFFSINILLHIHLSNIKTLSPGTIYWEYLGET